MSLRKTLINHIHIGPEGHAPDDHPPGEDLLATEHGPTSPTSAPSASARKRTVQIHTWGSYYSTGDRCVAALVASLSSPCQSLASTVTVTHRLTDRFFAGLVFADLHLLLRIQIHQPRRSGDGMAAEPQFKRTTFTAEGVVKNGVSKRRPRLHHTRYTISRCMLCGMELYLVQLRIRSIWINITFLQKS